MDKMIQSCLLLLQSRAKEVVKSVIGFFKVLIVILPIDDLGAYIPDLIEGLLLWSGEHTNHFKSRVKHILERIMKKIGFSFLFFSFFSFSFLFSLLFLFFFHFVLFFLIISFIDTIYFMNLSLKNIKNWQQI